MDIVKIERIRQSVAAFGESFLERVYTRGETDYCNKKKDPYPSLAARFAAKEAVIKALRGGLIVPMNQIEVAMDEYGKPSIAPGPALRKAFDAMGVGASHLSLTHEKEYAVAQVVLEGDGMLR